MVFTKARRRFLRTMIAVGLLSMASPATGEHRELSLPEEFLATMHARLGKGLAENLPERHVDRSLWGRAVIRRCPVVVRDGFRIQVHWRRYRFKEGLWEKHSLRRLNIDAPPVAKLSGFHWKDEDAIGFRVRVEAEYATNSRFAHWVGGVRTFEVPIVGRADVGATLDCTARLVANGQYLEFAPTAETCSLRLRTLRLDRVGMVEGRLVDELAPRIRACVEKRLRRHEKRIQREINAVLVKLVEDGEFRLRFDTGALRRDRR